MLQSQIENSITFDVHDRSLHLLPVLQVDPFDKVDLEGIVLSVSVSWLDGPVAPRTGWTIRQPYPNKLYFVGGGQDCHLGHFIGLPENQQAGEVTFNWKVGSAALPPGRFDVSHRIKLTFDQGEGRTWSMDVANWWEQSNFSNDGHATPQIGRNRFSRLKKQGVSPLRNADVSEAIRAGCRHIDIQESLNLPAIRLSECWTVESYGGNTITKYLGELR